VFQREERKFLAMKGKKQIAVYLHLR
jgi:hypothetical protein